MPRYFVQRYSTDINYALYGVSMAVETLAPVASSLDPLDYLPGAVRALYQPLPPGYCALIGVSPRSVYLWAGDGSEHSIELPIAGYDAEWNGLIAALESDARILRFRVLGERIDPYRFERILARL